MKATKKRSGRKDSIGAEIVRRLEHFVSVLESGEPLEKHFTIHRVALPLAPTPLTAKEVQQVRQLLSASQAVFARFLGVSPQTVRSWEQGVSTPSAMACRFLDEIRHNPAYWQQRLREMIVVQ
jgi:putative transcriptional regulator